VRVTTGCVDPEPGESDESAKSDELGSVVDTVTALAVSDRLNDPGDVLHNIPPSAKLSTELSDGVFVSLERDRSSATRELDITSPSVVIEAGSSVPTKLSDEMEKLIGIHLRLDVTVITAVVSGETLLDEDADVGTWADCAAHKSDYVPNREGLEVSGQTWHSHSHLKYSRLYLTVCRCDVCTVSILEMEGGQDFCTRNCTEQ